LDGSLIISIPEHEHFTTIGFNCEVKLNRSKFSLLYIEDDAIVRDIMCSFINARYTTLPIYSAGTAEEGLELFRKHRQSIVLTDINLSASDGVSMARSIRSIAPDTVIVFISGSSDVERLAEFKESGHGHFICKPVDCNDLFRLLDRYVNVINDSHRLPGHH
jgi:YesN/AraC family two-component response regulator